MLTVKLTRRVVLAACSTTFAGPPYGIWISRECRAELPCRWSATRRRVFTAGIES